MSVDDSLYGLFHVESTVESSVESSVEFFEGTMLDSFTIFWFLSRNVFHGYVLTFIASPHDWMLHIVSVWSGWCWFWGHETTRGPAVKFKTLQDVEQKPFCTGDDLCVPFVSSAKLRVQHEKVVVWCMIVGSDVHIRDQVSYIVSRFSWIHFVFGVAFLLQN